MKIGVISTAAYCLPLLQFLANNKLQVSVFTDACNYNNGEFDGVLHYCNAANIHLTNSQPHHLYTWLQQQKPDVVFMIGYRHLIDITKLPAELQEQFYNIHFSALPSYMGPMPVFWQLKHGVSHLAASIHRINEKFDAGPLFWVKQIEKEAHFSYGIAHMILTYTAIEGVTYIIQHTIQHKTIPVITANDIASSCYGRPALNDVVINWDTMTAGAVIDLINACNPWNKGAITFYRGTEIKIIDAERSHLPNNTSLPPGSVIFSGNDLHITCKGNETVKLNMLNMDGNFVPGRYAASLGITQGRFGN